LEEKGPINGNIKELNYAGGDLCHLHSNNFIQQGDYSKRKKMCPLRTEDSTNICLTRGSRQAPFLCDREKKDFSQKDPYGEKVAPFFRRKGKINEIETSSKQGGNGKFTLGGFLTGHWVEGKKTFFHKIFPLFLL